MGSWQELGGKYKGKRPLENHRCRWEDNTEMDFNYKWCENVGLIYMVQGRIWWQARVNAISMMGWKYHDC